MKQKTECTFLGTSAADFALLRATDCKDRFDKNARRASCMMIGENYLIDCGMHVPDSLRIARKDPAKITDIFVTHFHADHFIREHAEAIAENKSSPVRLWCRRDAVVPEMKNIDVIHMEDGVYYHVSPGMNVKAVYANHDEASFPQHFVFDIDGAKLMYATDGAWITARAFQYLKKVNLDVLIIDATCGDYPDDYRQAEHNSIPMIRLMLPFMRTAGIIHDKTRVYLTHMAPSLHKPHDETQKLAEKDGMTAAYDGMTFSL